MRAQRGTTILELVFASFIFLAVSGAVLGLFISMLRAEQSNTVLLMMNHESAALHRELRQISANGANIAVSGGEVNNDVVMFRRLSDESETPVFSEMRYVDEDGDNDTIGDNAIVLIPDRTDPDTRVVLMRLVSRLRDPDDPDEFLPVFTRSPGFGSPLVVQFRVGDRSAERTSRMQRANNDEDARDDALTGPGYQGMVFQAAYGPRNG